MGEFKLFMESITNDIASLCKSVESAPEDQKKDYWDILIDIYPQIIDNKLKYDTLVNLYKEIDTNKLEVKWALNNFIKSGADGFGTFDKSNANFIMYKRGKQIPKLSLHVLSDTRNGVEYFGTVLFKKSHCDKVIEHQMSIVQYSVELGQNTVRPEDVDMDKIDLVSSYNNEILYHGLTDRDPEETKEFQRQVRERLHHCIATTARWGHHRNHIEVVYDFEDYDRLLDLID